jgi:hypothetical protein
LKFEAEARINRGAEMERVALVSSRERLMAEKNNNIDEGARNGYLPTCKSVSNVPISLFIGEKSMERTTAEKK